MFFLGFLHYLDSHLRVEKSRPVSVCVQENIRIFKKIEEGKFSLFQLLFLLEFIIIEDSKDIFT